MKPLWAVFALALPALSLPATAQMGCTDDAMVVFDGSGSMAEMGFNHIDTPRIFEAREAMAKAMPEIAEVRRLGLILYGPGGPDACSGIDLRFSPKSDAADDIIAAVEGLEPLGETALTRAVAEAAALLLASQGGGTVVLVTDGQETCGGSPCTLAAELAAENITAHVIGFKVRGPFFAWDNQAGSAYREAESNARCIADRTGGHYVGAETVDELTAALRKTLGCNVLF